MPNELSPGKRSTRRYTPEEKAQAVRLVRQLRKELGTSQGTVARVAAQLGYGVESVRLWVRQADIDDGREPGVSTDEAARVRELEQEVRELRRANEILKRAASFFGAELDCQPRRERRSLTPTATTWSRGSRSRSSPSAGSCRWPRAASMPPRPAYPRRGRVGTRS